MENNVIKIYINQHVVQYDRDLTGVPKIMNRAIILQSHCDMTLVSGGVLS
jgi:hypothetical protein